MVLGRTNATIWIFLTFYSKRASHQRCSRISGLQSSSKLFDESLETITPAVGISINPLYSSDSIMSIFFQNTEDSNEMAQKCSILSMSTLTDLQRNKCNILPRDIITYDTSIIQWNYPSPFSNNYFYPCRYFTPQMHLSEILRLHVQVRAVGSG